jgi:hypothetical protein
MDERHTTPTHGRTSKIHGRIWVRDMSCDYTCQWRGGGQGSTQGLPHVDTPVHGTPRSTVHGDAKMKTHMEERNNESVRTNILSIFGQTHTHACGEGRRRYPWFFSMGALHLGHGWVCLDNHTWNSASFDNMICAHSHTHAAHTHTYTHTHTKSNININTNTNQHQSRTNQHQHTLTPTTANKLFNSPAL